jgi:Domain of unknown function (DUF4878)
MIKKFIPSLLALTPSQLVVILSLLALLMACGDQHSFRPAENAQDAGREFIRASLDGDYEKASFYLYLDSAKQNKMMLDKWKRDYDALGSDERQKYKDAEIMPINIRNVNDSQTLYTYANSYIKDTTTIKIVHIKGEWLVDFKEILNPKK